MQQVELIQAKIYTCITIIGVLIGGINWTGILEALPHIAHTVTIGAGLMAIRNWYYVTKKNKNNG